MASLQAPLIVGDLSNLTLRQLLEVCDSFGVPPSQSQSAESKQALIELIKRTALAVDRSLEIQRSRGHTASNANDSNAGLHPGAEFAVVEEYYEDDDDDMLPAGGGAIPGHESFAFDDEEVEDDLESLKIAVAAAAAAPAAPVPVATAPAAPGALATAHMTPTTPSAVVQGELDVVGSGRALSEDDASKHATFTSVAATAAGLKGANDGSAPIRTLPAGAQWRLTKQVTTRFVITETVPVGGTGGEKKFTAYVVRVVRPDGTDHAVLKRYRQFHQLHQLLKRDYPSQTKSKKGNPLKFTKKKLLGNMNTEFVQKRCKKLEMYLNAAVELPYIDQRRYWNEFVTLAALPSVQEHRASKKTGGFVTPEGGIISPDKLSLSSSFLIPNQTKPLAATSNTYEKTPARVSVGLEGEPEPESELPLNVIDEPTYAKTPALTSTHGSLMQSTADELDAILGSDDTPSAVPVTTTQAPLVSQQQDVDEFDFDPSTPLDGVDAPPAGSNSGAGGLSPADSSAAPRRLDSTKIDALRHLATKAITEIIIPALADIQSGLDRSATLVEALSHAQVLRSLKAPYDLAREQEWWAPVDEVRRSLSTTQAPVQSTGSQLEKMKSLAHYVGREIEIVCRSSLQILQDSTLSHELIVQLGALLQEMETILRARSS